MTEAAQIHPEVSFSNFQLTRSKTAVVVKDVDIKVSLVAVDCWVIDQQQSDSLLKHEQGHFDICAISARDLYKAILAVSAKSTQDLQVEISKLQLKFAQKAALTDANYDNFTNHGSKADIQLQWDQIIETTKKNVNGTIDNLPS